MENQTTNEHLVGHFASIVPSPDGTTVTIVIQDMTGTIHVQLIWTLETFVRMLDTAPNVLDEAFRRQKQAKEDRERTSRESDPSI